MGNRINTPITSTIFLTSFNIFQIVSRSYIFFNLWNVSTKFNDLFFALLLLPVGRYHFKKHFTSYFVKKYKRFFLSSFSWQRLSHTGKSLCVAAVPVLVDDSCIFLFFVRTRSCWRNWILSHPRPGSTGRCMPTKVVNLLKHLLKIQFQSGYRSISYSAVRIQYSTGYRFFFFHYR